MNKDTIRSILDNTYIFTHLTDALLVLNPGTWEIIESNDRAAQLLGVEDKSQLIAQTLSAFWKEEEAPTLIRQLTPPLTAEGQDIEYQRPSGDTFWGNTSRVQSPETDFSTLLLRIVDVSQRKQREQKLIEAKEAAEQAMKSQEAFLATMSHEIRTPLNALLGLADLMLDNNPREDQKKLLETMKFSGDNLTTLVNDILNYAKLEAGEVVLDSKPFHLLTFIQGTKLTYKNLATRQGVSFRLLLEDDLPEVVLGDVNRLGQILNNLLNNAVKFTQQGQIVLSVHGGEIRDDQHTLIFEITDTGVGIPASRLPVIFDPYQQASSDTARQYGGTGLGLSIVKNLVERQGGEITLRSTEGEGTTFRVHLPFCLPESKAEARISPPRLSSYPSLSGLRVLYADDVIPNQLLMEGLANQWNITLDTALDGQEALEKAKQHHYDVILMDIQMPVMDGYQATRQLRSLGDSHYQTVPIIALSASVSDDIRHCIHQAGMDDYLPKPLDAYQLHTKLLAVAEQQHSSKPADTKEIVLTDRADFTQLRELYINDDEGYIRMLEQIGRLTTESEAIIVEAILGGKRETLRFATHKMMSYVRMLKLRHLEELLSVAKQQMNHPMGKAASGELIERIRFHFDNFMVTITQEIEVHIV